MVSQKFVISNNIGLHLKPATMLCTEAIKYESSIMLTCKNARVNAKSVLNVLGAGIRRNDEFELVCDGEDEKEALENLANLVQGHFGKMIS